MELTEVISVIETAYCCNQATKSKVNNHKNYASTYLCERMKKIQEILLDLLADDTCNKLLNCNHEKRKRDDSTNFLQHNSLSLVNGISENMNLNSNSGLKIVNVGNKSTRELNEIIDYSDMPKIYNVSKQDKKELNRNVIRLKRINEDCDETDSSFDCRRLHPKRFKCSQVESFEVLSLKKQVFSKTSLVDYSDMSEKHLWNLANSYAALNEYKEIAIGLGVDETDILITESKYLVRDGLKECFYQCLLTWRLNQPENCSLEYFCQVLKNKLHRDDDQIEKFLKKLTEANSESSNQKNLNKLKSYGLKSDENKVKLSESDLWDASSFMAHEWKAIGRSLNLSEIDLKSIEAKYLFNDGIRECCYQTLLLWSQVLYENSTLECLCLNLLNMKFNLFAKQIIENIAM